MIENDITHYPNKVEMQHQFIEELKDEDGFYDKKFGKYAPFMGEDGPEFMRDDTHFTDAELYTNKYIVDDFLNWKRWNENGRNIFTFSEELLREFTQRNVDDIRKDQFKLPFDHFYISLKKLQIKVAKDSDKIIEGVYIHNDKAGQGTAFSLIIHFEFVGDFLDILLNSLGNDSESGFGDEAAKYWNYSLFFGTENPDETVKEVINESVDLFKSIYFPDEFDDEPIEDKHLDLLNYHLQLIDKTFNTVINCLLYLSRDAKEISTSTELQQIKGWIYAVLIVISEAVLICNRRIKGLTLL